MRLSYKTPGQRTVETQLQECRRLPQSVCEDKVMT